VNALLQQLETSRRVYGGEGAGDPELVFELSVVAGPPSD
jgi:hypothetical protein